MQVYRVLLELSTFYKMLERRNPSMEPSSHPVVWVFGQFNLCGQAGSWEKAGCEAGQEGPQGGWRGVMNYGRGPGAPVGGQHLYHATRAGRRGMAVIQ